MVAKTNAFDAIPSKQVGQLAAPSVRFLKKIIARIDTVSAHYQAPLTKLFHAAVAASRGSIRRDNAARLTRMEHLINGAR